MSKYYLINKTKTLAQLTVSNQCQLVNQRESQACKITPANEGIRCAHRGFTTYQYAMITVNRLVNYVDFHAPLS